MEILEKAVKYFPTSVAVLYFLGFFIWNTYLSLLGFSRYDIFQLRYILTGLLYVVLLVFFSTLLVTSLYWLQLSTNKSISFTEKYFNLIKAPGFVFLVCTSLFVFIVYAFPFVPDYFGGGNPRAIALIAEPGYLEFLEEFSVPSTYTKQTDLLCVLYENDNVIVVMLEGRLMELDKAKFFGKVSLPSQDSKLMKNECARHVLSYVDWSKRRIQK